MRTEIIEILARILRVDAGSIADDSSPDTISTWDSLSHLEIIAALEREYGLKFNIREIQSMDSVRNIESALDAHKVEG